jgi:hypothetical protein
MAELSSDQQFQRVLAVAEDQLKNKKIQVRFGPDGKMSFVIDEEGLTKALTATAASGLSEQTFREIFHNELGPLMEAVIRSTLDRYIDMQARLDEKSARESVVSTVKQRSEIVEKTLVNDDLRARYLIKTSSKHPRLRAADWEVVKKVALPNKGPILRPYATLSLETVWPEPASALVWFPFFPDSPGRKKSVSFDCDEEDLNDLIKMLQEARDALARTTA